MWTVLHYLTYSYETKLTFFTVITVNDRGTAGACAVSKMDSSMTTTFWSEMLQLKALLCVCQEFYIVLFLLTVYRTKLAARKP